MEKKNKMMCEEVKNQNGHYPRKFNNLFLADILESKQPCH